VTLDDLAAELRRFAAERDWEQFHTPKNLAISLAVEVGELLEHVQWGSDAEIAANTQRYPVDEVRGSSAKRRR
jgi:NTP pyrophosphatase (non-canonical NTP hydrolase)